MVKDRSIFLNRFIKKVRESQKVESWNWKRINALFVSPARSYIKKGEYARAKRVLLEGFRRSSGDPHIAFWLGELSGRIGRKDEAIVWFGYAKENYPLVRFRQIAEQRLREIIGSTSPARSSPTTTPIDSLYAHATHREGEKKDSSWVATVIVQSNGRYSNYDRIEDLQKIAVCIYNKSVCAGDGIVLFPGGWLNARGERPIELYRSFGETMSQFLNRFRSNIVISLGVDGRFSKDQLAVSFGKIGIAAIGRKFYPAPREEGIVELASSHLADEDGKSRLFELDGRRYFLCACYDSFGIRKARLQNPGVEAILDHVHCFRPKGKGMSGDVYYAKYGFAGASKQWGCLVFGATVFYNRRIPLDWPSCVLWNQGGKGTQLWRYSDNPIQPNSEFNIKINEGIALTRIFNL